MGHDFRIGIRVAGHTRTYISMKNFSRAASGLFAFNNFINFHLLDNIFYVIVWLVTFDQDIIRLPRLFRFLQKPLAQFISVARAPKSKEGYASIGGGSPLRKITDEQACFPNNLLHGHIVYLHFISFKM